MAVKVELWVARVKKDGSMPVVAIVNYKNYKKRIGLHISVMPERWHQGRENIKNPKGLEMELALHIEREKSRLNDLFIRAKLSGYSVAKFRQLLQTDQHDEKLLSEWLANFVKIRGGSRVNDVAIQSFIRLVGDLLPEAYDANHVRHWVNVMLEEGKPSTAERYLIGLRSFMKKMARDGMNYNDRIFDHIKISVPKKVRFALKDDELLRVLRAAEKYKNDEALQRFKYSLFCCGIDYGDLMKIDWPKVENNVIMLMRAKTGNSVNFTLPSEVLDLKFRKKSNFINFALSRARCEVPQFNVKLARHCWASIAQKCGVPKDVISEAMGHRTGGVTEVYLMSHNVETIDKANRLVIDYVLRLMKAKK
jgi:integrase